MAEIARVGILGAGLMGHGIAQVSAQAGYSARQWPYDQPAEVG